MRWWRAPPLHICNEMKKKWCLKWIITLSERVFWISFHRALCLATVFPVSTRWCYKWVVLTIWTYGPFIYLALLSIFGKCQSVPSLSLFCSNQDKTLFIYLFLQFVSFSKWQSMASDFSLRILCLFCVLCHLPTIIYGRTLLFPLLLLSWILCAQKFSFVHCLTGGRKVCGSIAWHLSDI